MHSADPATTNENFWVVTGFQEFKIPFFPERIQIIRLLDWIAIITREVSLAAIRLSARRYFLSTHDLQNVVRIPDYEKFYAPIYIFNLVFHNVNKKIRCFGARNVEIGRPRSWCDTRRGVRGGGACGLHRCVTAAVVV